MSEGGLLVMGSAGESVPGLPPAAGIVAAPWLVAASLLSLLTWPSPRVSVSRFSSGLPRGSDGK